MQSKTAASISLISFSLLSMEMIWTRILSAEFFYTFAFLILSLAVLGLGIGALSLRLIPKLKSPLTLPVSAMLAGIMILVGPVLVYRSGLNFSHLHQEWGQVFRLLYVIMLLGSASFFAGLAAAFILRQNHSQINSLYMFDLFGAGMGVILAIFVMNAFGTPAASLIMAIPLFIVALQYSRDGWRLIPIGLTILTLIGSVYADRILVSSKPQRAPVIYEHWDANSQIRMFAYPGDEARGLVIDQAANTPVYRFDGDFSHPDSVPEETWGIPVGDLIARFDSCRFLSLGSGGGADVLQALMEGATEVVAVEVNPWLNKLLLEGDRQGYLSAYTDTLSTAFISLPEYTSSLYHDPRVTVVTEDARAYVRQAHEPFDLIYSLSSNSFAALASGSFALAENYLFTTEAFQDYWHALSDSGFLMMEHQFYMPKLVSEALQALQYEGVEFPHKHMAVYNLPKMRRMVLLLSKQVHDEQLLQRALTDMNAQNFEDIHLLFPASDSTAGNDIQAIIETGWQVHQDSMAIDIRPNTDNRPFVAQMGQWKNFTFDREQRLLPYEFFGFPLTKLILVIISAVTLVFIIPLTWLPYIRRGPKLKWGEYAYFALIGYAFMAIELILIQQFALLIGPSVYSLATILFTILISSGLGSRWSDHFQMKHVLAIIVIWILLEGWLLHFIIAQCGNMPQGIRMLLAMIMVAPLSFAMGMPFPKGVHQVGALVDWGFSVNGAAGVLGSTLTLLIVMAYGFTAGLMAAATAYAIAAVLYFGMVNPGPRARG